MTKRGLPKRSWAERHRPEHNAECACSVGSSPGQYTRFHLTAGDSSMPTDSALQTSASLLTRLREEQTNQTAWADFVRRYGPLILGWCRHWKLQESDAQDVTQVVLAKLVEKMRTFQYDPARSFRAYLKTLARYAWCDFL